MELRLILNKMQNFFRLKKRQGGYTNCYLEYPVGEGYRVPTIDEFVQGFEFEVCKEMKLIHLGMTQKQINSIPYSKVWTPMKVNWKYDPKILITRTLDNGMKVTTTGSFENFFKPFDEQLMIDQKLVRVKINKDG